MFRSLFCGLLCAGAGQKAFRVQRRLDSAPQKGIDIPAVWFGNRTAQPSLPLSKFRSYFSTSIKTCPSASKVMASASCRV